MSYHIGVSGGNSYSPETYYGQKAAGPPSLKYCGPGDYICPGYNVARLSPQVEIKLIWDSR